MANRISFRANGCRIHTRSGCSYIQAIEEVQSQSLALRTCVIVPAELKAGSVQTINELHQLLATTRKETE